MIRSRNDSTIFLPSVRVVPGNSDLVAIQFEQGRAVAAVLEDIAPSGARLGMEQSVARGAKLLLNSPGCRLRGKVQYCVAGEAGYQVGLQFVNCKWSQSRYSPEHLLPESFSGLNDRSTLFQDEVKMRRLVTDVTGVSGTDLDVESDPCAPDRDDNLVESCEAHQAQMTGSTRCCDEASCPRADIVALTQRHQLTEEVRYVARAVAWTRERLYPEDLKQCFSRSFELPPECMLCNEFVRAYGEECEAISKRSSPPKYGVAGGTVDSSPASPDPGTSNQHIPWTP